MPATSLSLSAAFNSSALDLVAICYELLLFCFVFFSCGLLTTEFAAVGRSVGF
jgi:hypothetical protein